MADDSRTVSNKAWNVMQAMIGTIVVLGLFGVFATWIFLATYADISKLDAGVLAILNNLTGAIATLAVAVVSYYFGSSKSSADKDETAKIATRAAADAASTTSSTLDKVISGTGAGVTNGNGDPHATTVSVTPPQPPDSVKVETKITKTSDKKEKSRTK